MALTLLMMATVIAVFASISESVADRRSTIEMGNAMRHARTMLQADLAGATCPAIPWQRPESNHGYLEIIEGPQCDFDPSIWLRDANNDGTVDSPMNDSGGDPMVLDLAVSQLPSSNLGRLPGSTAPLATGAVTDGGGLGDWDDTLMLTVRNEQQPFVGRVPNAGSVANEFNQWEAIEVESQLAEVVWFALENPVEENRSFYFGEPGFRTVYRRALLIAPWLDFGFVIDGVETGPGVVRVLGNTVNGDEPEDAIAALIAFQDLYDLSVRLEWDPLLGNDGRWVIKANTLADLTKRENRYEHVDLTANMNWAMRYPHRSVGVGPVTGGMTVEVGDANEVRQYRDATNTAQALAADAAGAAVVVDGPSGSDVENVLFRLTTPGGAYGSRPYAYLTGPNAPTVRAILNENGSVVGFTTGLVPLGGDRRGEDVMLSNMLAFDIKVYDPEAPVLAEISDTSQANYPGDAVDPGSPAWGAIAYRDFNSGVPPAGVQPVVSRGAYVDLGYFGLHAYHAYRNDAMNNYSTSGAWQALMGGSRLGDVMNQKAMGITGVLQFPGTGDFVFQPYRTYDTWSTSYENNGVNEDIAQDALIDEGTNGFDDDGAFGVDDPGERETAPPYDAPLRGVRITLRGYEIDSRQIREVNVKQAFVPK